MALRQIVVASEQEAKEVHNKLAAGVAFESLPGNAYLGRLRLSDLRNEVQKALESLVPGGVTLPVAVGNTYVLFQIVPEAEGRWLDLDEAGAQALTAGRISEAKEYFEQALAHAEAASLGEARLARSLDTLAGVYGLEGRAEEAEKLYRRALALLEGMRASDLEIAQVLAGLGMALVQQARFVDAEPLYERARSIRVERLGPDHPEVAAILHNIAELHAGRGRFTEASNLYQQPHTLLARTLGSDHPAALAAAQRLEVFRRSLVAELLDRFSTAAGLAEFRDAEFDRVMAEIRELLPLAPLSEQAFLQMKNILLEAGLSGETEQVLREGLKQFPESRILRIYLADVLAATGRTGNALGILQEAGRLSPAEGLDAVNERQQQGVILQRIGDIQLALTHVEDALLTYRRALEIDAASPDGRIKLGRAYFSSGRLDEALAEFERAIQETSDNAEAHLRLSETHLAAGRWEQAAAAAARAIELGATDSRALYLQGTALVRTGRREQGQELLQEFARVEAAFAEAEQRSREIHAIHTAAAEAFGKGQGDSAARQLAEGTKRFPDAGRLQMSLAIVQSRLGRHAMAIETLESMLERGAGRRFLIHKNLAAEYAIIGNMEEAGRHRQMYLKTRDSELLGNAKP